METFRRFFNKTVRSLPWVRRKLAAELEKIKVEMEEEIHQYDKTKDFYKFLPEHGSSVDDIVSEAEQYIRMSGTKQLKQNYELLDEGQLDLYSKIHELFSGSDPTKTHSFPGARKMETEIIRIVASMFHANSESCGLIAGKSTETLLLSCIGYRELAKKKGVTRPTILAPETASPILEQAVKLFNMQLKRIAVDENGEFNADLIRKNCSEETCFIIISAPNAITGTIDPIEAVAEIAHTLRIPLHIDCTAGGFILPFMEHCDFSLPCFDFRLPGVTSISVDLSNYNFSPSSCSVLLYRDSSYMRRQCFVHGGIPEGMFWSTTINGTRDGASVALAWASLLSHGRDGYLNECQKIVETTRQIADHLLAIDGICLKGSADLCIIAFNHEKIDIYDLVETMMKKGWEIDTLMRPKAARINISRAFCEEGIAEIFVRDVASVIIQLLSTTGGPKKSSRLSQLYTLLGSVSDSELINDVIFQRLLAQYSMTSSPERRPRTLSVEGRKMSFIAAAEAAKLISEVRARQEIAK